MKISLALMLVCIFFNFKIFSQSRTVEALNTSVKIKIDAEIDPEWMKTPVYSDFIQYEPYNGEKASQKTSVRFLYDNEAFYILAILYDNSPDSILSELSRRDETDKANTDVFGVVILPFNDDKNAFIFKVSAAGVQTDIKISQDEDDENWDAVWMSSVSVHDSGWTAELKIPYSAIRFPKKETQEWGINVWRHIRRYREWSSLVYINNNQSSFINESALLTGISNVKPPLRLSLFPYVAAYFVNSPDNSANGFKFNYGADLKYGISESFTLDMVLIPDFGQVESDEVVLNLSAFETQYDEKRQFFTEGTELFNKAGLFYSRRIGSMPHYFFQLYSLPDFKDVISNPDKTQLLNAFKISGRTNRELGIGLFNALTASTVAKFLDINDSIREFTTQPFTNYNILVVDQGLKNRSTIGIINTNLFNKDRIANVSAADYILEDHQNIFRLSGNFTVNYINDQQNGTLSGFRNFISFRKIKGNFRFKLSNELASSGFDINDMGYNSYKNYMESSASIAYNKYTPFSIFLNMYNSIGVNYITRLSPFEYSFFDIHLESHAKFKNHLDVGFNAGGTPVAQYDYYEPRMDGYKFRIPPYFWVYGWFSPDYRKKFVLDLHGSFNVIPEFNKTEWSIDVAPRIRLSNKIFMKLNFELEKNYSQRGYVETIPDLNETWLIIFGKRNLTTIENSIYFSYILTKNISLSLKARHYWSTADYQQFYKLNKNGTLTEVVYSENQDLSFDALTIDAAFIWQFAPGSEMSIVWKNNIFKEGTYINPSYLKNFEEVISQPAINSFSIKVLYYLDYNYLKK